MIEVNIGMSRADWQKALAEASAMLAEEEQGDSFTFSIYAKNNDHVSEDVTIQFNNDDMEGEDRSPGECYVEVVKS